VPRMPREAKLETREGRKRLKAKKEPYWRQIHTGLHIGYYKGAKSASWVVRTWEGGQNNTKKIGLADDYADADGREVLSYGDAVKVAMSGGIHEVRASTARSGYTVAECVKDYLEDYSARGKSLHDTELRFSKHVLPKFGKKPVSSLKSADLQNWLNSLAKGRVKATANRIWNGFRAALNYAYLHDKVENDKAWKKVRPFRNVEKPVERFLTKAEAKRLINGCDAEFKPMVRAALLTGCRYGELAAMLTNAYNHDSGTVAVVESKSGKPRHIPLTDEGCQWFDEWTAGNKAREPLFTRANGEAWGKSHQSRPMREACTKAKIEPAVSFHILRHTYGSLLVMEGVPLQVVAKALGHADTRMTERHYAHLQPDYVADTIRKHLPSFGGTKSKVSRIG
jgi:integrase